MKVFLNEKLQRVDVLDDRFYTEDNETFYPSVTTVLGVYPKGFGFNDWLKSNGYNADILLKRAGDQGSAVHNAIEDILNGRKLEWFNKSGIEQYTLTEWQMICRFMEFYDKMVDSVISVEQTMFSQNLEIGGTSDMVCMIDGVRWQVDYKTSNSIHKTHKIQQAVYKTMWDEKAKKQPIEKYGILWLNAKTRTEKYGQGKGWQLIDCTKDYQHHMRLYEATRTLWNEENPNYKPKNLSYPNIIQLNDDKKPLKRVS